MSQKRLQAYSKVPALSTAVILLVGGHGVGKHKLAQALVDLCTDFTLHVRTATSLPLPRENDESRSKIDFVVFLIDLSNKLSLSVIESSVKLLDIEYFLGKVCFVITKATKPELQNVEMTAVTGLCDAYDSPMLCGKIESDEDCRGLARKLIKMTEIAAGFKPCVTPMLIASTKRTLAFEETL
ncbi:centromere protein M-like [Ptychodera flava]|uniref:centromere protein M-like n=1 Tax=Ptychodera flava TaxID=63121 RepID=UPI00396A0AFD